jgi:hypothetical protein
MTDTIGEALETAIASKCAICAARELGIDMCRKDYEITPGVVGLEIALSDACEDILRAALRGLAKK